MTSETVLTQLAHCGVIPVIAIDSVASALPLADAMIAGGLPVAEITFRTDAAADVMEALTAERPDLLVGAGTVLTVANLERAHASGAKFAVAPGFNPAVVTRAAELGLPFAPGVMTPTDIEAALALGCKVLKYFPAGAMGGIKTINAVAAPYKHSRVKFVPTGGVKPDNLAEYIASDIIMAVGGTWIAKTDAIAAGDWGAITANCKEAMAIVQSVRAS